MDALQRNGRVQEERGDGIMLKLLNLLMFVACMIVAVLHFQHGNMCTATGMASLGIVNLLLGVR